MSKLTIGIVAGFMAVSTTATAQESDGASSASDERACFSIRQAQNMDAMHDRFIYLEGSGRQGFLLTMTGNCPNLSGTDGITITNRGQDRVCSGDSAQVAYRRNRTGPTMTCIIDTVTPVESEEAAEAMVESLTE